MTIEARGSGTPLRIPAPGFADPVRDAQRTFRAALDALARPTIPVALDTRIEAPGGLTVGAAALLLALADESTPLWLDPVLAGDGELIGWLRFHTGAPIVSEPGEAAFGVLGDAEALRLADFAQGSDEAPHVSATLICCLPEATGAGRRVVADGPGFPEPAEWAMPAGLPADFLGQWARNHATFPRGLDLILASDRTILGLPRTTSLIAEDPLPPSSGGNGVYGAEGMR